MGKIKELPASHFSHWAAEEPRRASEGAHQLKPQEKQVLGQLQPPAADPEHSKRIASLTRPLTPELLSSPIQG